MGNKAAADRIGGRIRELRKARRITQRDLAEAVGAGGGQSVAAKWESGRNLPAINTLEAIAHVLGVPISVFFEGETPEGGRDQPDLIDPRLARRLLLRSRAEGEQVHTWLVGELENVYRERGFQPDDFPDWLKENME